MTVAIAHRSFLVATLAVLLLPAVAAAQDGPPLAVCFAPGTPAERVAFEMQRLHDRYPTSLQVGSSRHQIYNRWTSTASDGSGMTQGDPVTITWSVVPDGTAVAGYNGEPAAPSNLRARLAAIYGTYEAGRLVIQQVFDAWEGVTGIDYVYQANDDGAALGSGAPGVLGTRGDVRLSGHHIDGNSGILAYNFYPNVGDMVLDTNDTFFDTTTNNSRRLRNTLAHEFGHGLGLNHVCPINQTKLMEPFLTTAFDGPQHDDVLANNRNYGDRYEDDDVVAQAQSLGAVAGTLSWNTLSVDDNLDLDYYRFDVSGPVTLAATLSPTGSTYLSGPQNGDGSCSAGSNYNSLTVHDLELEILATNGSTVLASANATGAGSSESLSGVSLPGAGSYYAVVGGSAADAAQLYTLQLQTTAAAQYTLTVTRTGAGSGTVTSTPAGIDCGADCSQSYGSATQVTLTATPQAGSQFSAWSGDADCGDGVVTMSGARTCTATFTLLQRTLSVSVEGTGGGSVASSPAGITCPGDCSQSYDHGTAVTLAAQAAAGSSFGGFTGDADCGDGVVSMTAARSCTATFTLNQYPLTVQVQGSGSGTVSSSPAGITCPGDCTQSYSHGTAVTLTPLAAAGSTFAGWSGDADCGDGVASMTAARTCAATFTAQVTLRTLVVYVQGGGSGAVTSSVAGITCPGDCTQDYPDGTTLTLTPAPQAGSTFAGWSGDQDCADAQLTMNANRTCIATFDPAPGFATLTLSRSGGGNGTVLSSPGGINCGSDCGESYQAGTTVTLLAIPATGSVSMGLGGDLDCRDGAVTMNGDRSCVGRFVPGSARIFADAFESGEALLWSRLQN